MRTSVKHFLVLIALLPWVAPPRAHGFQKPGKTYESPLRNVTLFTRGAFHYSIHVEVGASILNRPNDPPRDLLEMASTARSQLTVFYETITFH